MILNRIFLRIAMIAMVLLGLFPVFLCLGLFAADPNLFVHRMFIFLVVDAIVMMVSFFLSLWIGS